jgi:2-polyprenyl-3-methyl-5-hydroxy-6-metoxy-1,4-benzoquinol methylase
MPSKNLFTLFISFIKRKTSQKYRFNQQYEQKKWEGMRDIADLGRYSVIVGYTKHFCKNPRILDLGCGEGILLEKFHATDYVSYVGVDFSEVAIASAKKLENDHVKFIVGDLNKLSVTGTFDVIIYNESLYYMSNPKDAVRALFSHLSRDGVFIFSMVDKHGKERTGLWSALDEILNVVEQTKVVNNAGDSWTVRVYKIK